jgi:hypothetical protein
VSRRGLLKKSLRDNLLVELPLTFKEEEPHQELP